MTYTDQQCDVGGRRVSAGDVVNWLHDHGIRRVVVLSDAAYLLADAPGAPPRLILNGDVLTVDELGRVIVTAPADITAGQRTIGS